MEQTKKYITEVQSKGFTVIRDFVNSEQLKVIRAALSKIADESSLCENEFLGYKTVRSHNLLNKTREFDFLVADPQLLLIVEGVLGEHFQLSITAMINIGPGETSQVLHQDDSLWPISRPHPPLVLNTMLAITPFTAENGATKIVPGSHLSVEDVRIDEQTQPAELDAGSLLVWDGALWHAGGANNTDEIRIGLNINYNLSWLRQQENHYLAIKPDEVRKMPEGLQALIGYKSVFGFVGLVDLKEPVPS